LIPAVITKPAASKKKAVPVIRSAFFSNEPGLASGLCFIRLTIFQIPIPDRTSTKESIPKPNNERVSSAIPKNTDTIPSNRL
jgi:hypothetical protein